MGGIRNIMGRNRFTMGEVRNMVGAKTHEWLDNRSKWVKFGNQRVLCVNQWVK